MRTVTLEKGVGISHKRSNVILNPQKNSLHHSSPSHTGKPQYAGQKQLRLTPEGKEHSLPSSFALSTPPSDAWPLREHTF